MSGWGSPAQAAVRLSPGSPVRAFGGGGWFGCPLLSTYTYVVPSEPGVAFTGCPAIYAILLSFGPPLWGPDRPHIFSLGMAFQWAANSA
mmetsp:Transcript_92758/g.160687  ORF Transcript_92758/g.160687 Transcript_92758/m.160687 type:complete len:89 (+) Transcript_92758:123-389(+)